MPVVLSRKGFDSQYGGGPSPILPDGTLVSLPIPAPDATRYKELSYGEGHSVDALLTRLGIEPKFKPQKMPARRSDTCHLDPDLHPGSIARQPGWRPSLGQVGAAQRHLERKGVGLGDLFLFFGWFRRTRHDGSGGLEWVEGDLHVLFGFLQVGQVPLRIDDTTEVPSWLAQHPHCSQRLRSEASNTVYFAGDQLSLDNTLPGAAMFRFDARLTLTKEGHTRSRWALPEKVFRDKAISYHSARSWRDGFFQSAARGQEFVVDANEAVFDWALDKIRIGIGSLS